MGKRSGAREQQTSNHLNSHSGLENAETKRARWKWNAQRGWGRNPAKHVWDSLIWFDHLTTPLTLIKVTVTGLSHFLSTFTKRNKTQQRASRMFCCLARGKQRWVFSFLTRTHTMDTNRESKTFLNARFKCIGWSFHRTHKKMLCSPGCLQVYTTFS